MEQAKVKLRETEADWGKMANALANTFTPDDEELPVELISFEGEIFENKIKLIWQTATETKNYGFDVEKSNSHDIWEKIAFVDGHGNSSSPKEYIYFDENPSIGKNKYRLKQIDIDGAFKYLETLEIEIGNTVPNKLTLFQNYPNPFNPSTTIKFIIPGVGEENFRHLSIHLIVYDLLGRKVATLVNQELPAGYYEVEFDASNLPSGFYYYKIDIGGKFNSVKKMILLK